MKRYCTTLFEKHIPPWNENGNTLITVMRKIKTSILLESVVLWIIKKILAAFGWRMNDGNSVIVRCALSSRGLILMHTLDHWKINFSNECLETSNIMRCSDPSEIVSLWRPGKYTILQQCVRPSGMRTSLTSDEFTAALILMVNHTVKFVIMLNTWECVQFGKIMHTFQG